jgi:preprotein translocase subunit SecY
MLCWRAFDTAEHDMASAAEQLAASINWSSFSKADELKKRIWFTLGALVIYRLGTYIPLPGINPDAYATAFNGQSQGILGLFNMFSGGAVSRMAIFALAIMPYISASIIIQLLTTVVPQLEALKKEGEQGRKIMNQYTRYLTVVLATAQAWGIAVGLEGGQGIVTMPGLFFKLSTTLTLVGGTMFLLWLGEQITSRGIGNGTSLLIQAGIVAEFPAHLGQMFDLGRTGGLNPVTLFIAVIVAVAVVLAIVFFERAQRRLIIQYPKRQVGNRVYESQSSHLPLKLNTSGVIPPIFASSLLLLPTTAATFVAASNPNSWLANVAIYLNHGKPLFMVLYAILIVFFCFFYTAIVFNPTETADNLKKHGGFILGYRPGEATAKFIDYVLTRITVVGAIYIALVCMVPEIENYMAPQIPFVLGGTSLLITVSVAMDTLAQIHGHLLAHQYEGLVRKTKLKGRRG